MSLYVVKSSRNIFMKLSIYFLNAFVIILWNVGGPFFTPKGITLQINTPQSLTNIFFYLSFGIMDIWWYPKYPSKEKYSSHPTNVFHTSYVNGNGKGSFFIVAFSFLKSTQILSFPYFLATTTIGDNHVASSTSCIKFVVNSLSIHVSLLQHNLDLTYTWPNVQVVWLYPIQFCAKLTPILASKVT